MSATTIPLWRAWNSWMSERPAAIVHQPLGIYCCPFAYADSNTSLTDFPAGENTLLGPRTLTANPLTLTLKHSGTVLDWRYFKPDPFTLCGQWRTVETGEWGLRFWLLLVFSTDRAHRWHYDAETGLLSTRIDHRHVVVNCARKPLFASFHRDEQAFITEMTTKGYFYLGSRGDQGSLAVLRFNLEEMPEQRFAISLADAGGLAAEKTAAALTDNKSPPLPEHESAQAAVRDVIAWNTVWDSANQRSYTALSRHWNQQKFGGFGLWLDDMFYHALMAGLIDSQLVRENLAAVFAGLTPQGNLPCLLTGNDAWVDRSQPPVGSFIVWLLYRQTAERSLLEMAYFALKSNHEWWWRERDRNGDGLLEYGTSEVGSGLYLGTKLAAKDESGMDNSPIHDEAELDLKTRTLTSNDVGLNSLYALDGEMLALIADRVGDPDTARMLRTRSDALKQRIREQLWDDSRSVFANRLWSGKYVRSLAPTSFFPMLAGAATPIQAQLLVEHYLCNPERFGGERCLPSVSRDDPAFSDNRYWRGRIWPPLNFLVYFGLRRYGYKDIASELVANGYQLFDRSWQQRHCPENFNAVTGEALDQPDTDSFYSWGALLAYLRVIDTNSLFADLFDTGEET